jgi:hypothetical protein
MTGEEMEGAVRRRRVPKKLVGRKQKEILEWARSELNGEEPNLKSGDLRKIREGEISEVTLRPKKKGFFLPDGTFVEAFDYSPEIGGDLEKAEEIWDEEEQVREWVDVENERFNKTAVEESNCPLRLMWEHGKRIEEFSQENGTPIFRLQNTLVERGGADSYALQSHQFCTDLYDWRPDATLDDRIFTLSWELVDAMLRFSRRSDIRDHVKEVVISELVDNLSEREVTRLLGTKGPNYYPEDKTLTDAERETVNEIRRRLLDKENLDPQSISMIRDIYRESVPE